MDDVGVSVNDPVDIDVVVGLVDMEGLKPEAVVSQKTPV